MVQLKPLLAHCDALLAVERFKDYAPNGLQVEGRNEVRRIVSGVTASLALIDAAIEVEADLLLVHHGWFWKGEPSTLSGWRRTRMARLLGAGLSLVGYHLPLDAHPQLGNNARLREQLGLIETGRLATPSPGLEVWCGRLPQAESPAALSARIDRALGRTPLHIAGGPAQIETVAWCSGGAQGYIELAADAGVDAYLSGEVSEPTVHIAREAGLHYFACGHHATERGGVAALGDHLARHFGLEHRFIDLPHPV